jgi:hypothetical protein
LADVNFGQGAKASKALVNAQSNIGNFTIGATTLIIMPFSIKNLLVIISTNDAEHISPSYQVSLC